jgi:hypothetical protein
MSKKKDDRPLTFKIANWYGVIFASMFLLYGGVKVILNILDRNYQNMGQPFAFALIGVVLFSFVIAYRELKVWGWYGLVGINGLVILLALLDFSHYENVVVMILSGIALYALLSPQTKNYLFKRQ